MSKTLKIITPLLFGLIGGFISTNILNQPVLANKNLKVLEAEEFRLVDKNGNNKGGMKSLNDGSSLIYLQGGSNLDQSGVKIIVDKTASSFQIYNKEGRLVSHLFFNSQSKTSALQFLNPNGFDSKKPTGAEVSIQNSEKHSGFTVTSENKPLISLETADKKDNPSLMLLSKNGKSNGVYIK